MILGNDALIAARPSTPAQLASACVLAGFDIILPPSAGDEIVAAAYLDRLGQSPSRVVLACACPHVRFALAERPTRTELPRITVASPPVAAARYLRALHGDDVLITYVGDCPGAADPAIDARFTPSGFLASLHRQGIAIEEQPDRDRHGIAWGRHLSTPGGFPARRYAAKPPADRVVREVARDDLRAADVVNERSRVVVDVIDAACVCSQRREESMELEPTRSTAPLFAIPANLDLSPDSSLPRLRPSLRTKDGLAGDVHPTTATESSAGSTVPPRVRTAPHRVVRPAGRAPQPLEVRPIHRPFLLVVLPVVVVGMMTALGIAAYTMGSSNSRRGGYAGNDTPATQIDSGESVGSRGTARGARTDSALAAPAPTASVVDSAPPADSARRDSTRTVADSAARRRPRRARPAEVIPGWLPQGQPTWVPDSQAGRRPDTLSAPRMPPRDG